MIYQRYDVVLHHGHFFQFHSVCISDAKKEFNGEVLWKLEFFGRILVHVVLREQKKEYLGDLDGIELRTNLLHVCLVLRASWIIRDETVIFSYIIGRILFIHVVVTRVSIVSLLLFLPRRRRGSLRAVFPPLFAFITRIAFFLVRRWRPVLALKYRINHLCQCSQHQFTPLLRKKNETLKKLVQNLSHKWILPVEPSIEPLND